MDDEKTVDKALFKPVDANASYIQMEKDVLDFWRINDIFHKSLKAHEEGDLFVFYEGPPTANGLPGSHHVLARSYKDVICRHRTMQGFQVPRKGGWDTHGLPVELEVEKALGISGKQEIETFGIEKFNKRCKESVMKYTKQWEELTQRIGFWVDIQDAYVTYTNEYIESLWWVLKEIWKKGLLYEDYKVIPYCPRCGTALSSHEVAQGYAEAVDPSIYLRFKLDEEDASFLVWTTTPWTLPGNIALAVHPEHSYSKVDLSGETLIMATVLAEEVLGEEAKVIESFPGSKLLGKKYQPVFDYYGSPENAHRVVAGQFVTLTEGTGIVHIAPAYGEDDMSVSRREGLPINHPVNEEGKFREEVSDWAGIFVKDADPLIIDKLRSEGKLFRTEEYRHTYPFCWRCDTPLLYYAKTSWFIRTTAVKEKLIELNQTIHWVPETVGQGRFGNWLENLVDWALSRERYWGTPLPIWRCVKCEKIHCVGSIQELKEMSRENFSQIELHRPFVDMVVLECSDCGGDMRRVTEVADAWFDSGAMPVAQWHYPFESQENFKNSFPADFISEGVDQTRGWFFSLHALATLLFDSVAYKNVISLGHILDENGEKMSKHKGNVIEPWQVLDRYGADAFRWYLYTVSPPGNPKRFSIDAVGEIVRKFLLTLWNTYSFFVTYANIDGFDPSEHKVPVAERSLLDRWLISRMNSLILKVNQEMEDYEVTAAGRPVMDFIDELSNWYVRRSRRRFWKSEEDTDKASAYVTLYEVLTTVSKLLAPFTPFIAEDIYRNLNAGVKGEAESVHLARYPVTDESCIDPQLEEAMGIAIRVVTMGRAARSKARIKVRQPLAELWVKVPEGTDRELLMRMENEISLELNVKKIKTLHDLADLAEYRVKPKLAVLGPKLGKLLPRIRETLNELNGELIRRELLTKGRITVTIDKKQFELKPDELIIEEVPREEFIIEESEGFLVALSTEVSWELKKEGIVREIIHFIQGLRKDSGLEISDRINLGITGDEDLIEIVEESSEFIKQETLAVNLFAGNNIPGNSGSKSIEGLVAEISLQKVDGT